MASFDIHGPFEIAFEARPGGRTLNFDGFWVGDAPASYLADKCGVYVFAISSGGGLTPIYVGKATKTFRQEAFNPSNKHKYHHGFSDYAKGTPVMFFVVHPSQRGRTNENHIKEIEDFLIQAGIAKNPDLQNIKGTGAPQWSIKGVIRSGVGKPSKAEVQFRKLFAIGE
jgi:hypothetical protein